MTEKANDWELLSQIKRGRQRKYVLKNTKIDNPLMVSEITKKANEKIRKNKDGKEIRLRDVSRALKWLSDKKLVKCLNPSSKHGVRGILYQMTKKGSRFLKNIRE